MARGRRPRQPKAEYSPAYIRRVFAKTGLTPEQAALRGENLGAVRGHRRIVGAPAEKAALDIRRRQRGELTDRERRFADKQAARLDADPAEIRAELRTMDAADRDQLITVQQDAERRYKASRYVESAEERTGSEKSKKGRKSKKYKKAYRMDLDPRQPMPFPHHSPWARLYFYH